MLDTIYTKITKEIPNKWPLVGTSVRNFCDKGGEVRASTSYGHISSFIKKFADSRYFCNFVGQNNILNKREAWTSIWILETYSKVIFCFVLRSLRHIKITPSICPSVCLSFWVFCIWPSLCTAWVDFHSRTLHRLLAYQGCMLRERTMPLSQRSRSQLTC